MRRGTRERIELRLRGRRGPFAVRRYVSTGRTVRVRVSVPERIRRLRRRPVPIEVRVRAPGDPVDALRWVIDLPR